MEPVFVILKYMSYVLAPLFTLFFFSCLINKITYPKSTLRLCDQLSNTRRTYYPMRPFLVAVTFWAIMFAL